MISDVEEKMTRWRIEKWPNKWGGSDEPLISPSSLTLTGATPISSITCNLKFSGLSNNANANDVSDKDINDKFRTAGFKHGYSSADSPTPKDYISVGVVRSIWHPKALDDRFREIVPVDHDKDLRPDVITKQNCFVEIRPDGLWVVSGLTLGDTVYCFV